MRSIHTHRDGRRDSSPVPPRHRVLCVSADSPSRLLRIAQNSPCADCGNQVHWYIRTDHQPVCLHPHELPTSVVPEIHRWHIGAGVAYPAGDGSPWCRIAHLTLCPARTAPEPLTQHLVSMRRRLALQTRRLLDTGAFIPPAQRPSLTWPGATSLCRPTRPVVDLFCGRYLAAQPIEDIRCVARTRRRTRCLNLVLATQKPHGTWRLAAAAPGSRNRVAPAVEIAVYDLGHLPYAEQQRWRAQHCPTHAMTPGAADMALADWEIFDPLLHRRHTATWIPTGVQDRPRRRS